MSPSPCLVFHIPLLATITYVFYGQLSTLFLVPFAYRLDTGAISSQGSHVPLFCGLNSLCHD